MKRCPECRRDYFDDTLLYCLDDGNALLEGPASGSEPPTGVPAGVSPSGVAMSSGVQFGDEPQTAILNNISSSPDAATRPRIDVTAGEKSAKNSIAVLPFVNMSADSENEYFCDGLAEEILNALARVDRLKVAARTSAFSFKGRNAKVSEIAAALNVNSVLEGSVRKSNDRLRITAQIVNAEDGYQLWSDRYDREMKDIFDIQDEIAMAVVEALKIKLLGEERATVLKRQTHNAEAYEFYLRGLSHFNKWTPTDFEKAIENFQRAIAIDPNYASAFAALADSFTELSFFSFSVADPGPRAREAAERALQLDDGLAEAHNSLALIKMYFDWDYAGAEAEFKRAVALNPGSALIHMWYGWYLGLTGRFDESLTELHRARELDPLSAPNNNAIGVVLHWSGETDRAIEQFEDVLELNPNYPVTVAFLAEAYVEKGDLVSAVATIERLASGTMDPQALSVMGYVYARSGDRDKALLIADEFAKRSGADYLPATNFAHIYAGLGDHEEALKWLAKACDDRVTWVPFMRIDPKLAVLRTDPRFRELLKRAGFTA